MADNTQTANVVLTANNQQYDRSMQQSSQATNNLVTSVIALSNGMNALAQRAGKKLQLVAAADVALIAGATAQAAKFDQQMSTLQANAIMTGRNVDTMTKQVNNLRGSFAVTTEQAVALQTQLRQMGQTQGLDKISESMVRLGAVTGESVGQLTVGLVGLQRQMGTLGSAYTEKFASALSNVAAKAGVSASAVLDFSNSIAPVAKVAGLSQKEVMGFSTAFVKAGQDSGAASTAFTKMLTDITRATQYGSPELKAYSNLIGVSVSQFKEMPRAEAVTRIFEEISKQGPDAIKTLDRFGLDGIRTYKALQGVAAQGGIRNAFKDVSEGYQDTSKFTKASNVAMDGMNDQLQKLGNNLSMVGEAFGKAFVGPTQAVISAINAVVRPLASMLQTLGNIPGVAALAGAGMVALGGTVVRSLGLMAGVSALRTLTNGTTAAGFRTGRGTNNKTAQRAAATYAAGGGSRLQRATFEAGNRIGARLARLGFGGMNPYNERVGSGAFSQMAGMGVRGIGAFARAQIDQLQPRRFFNPMYQAASTTRTAGGLRTEELGRSLRNLLLKPDSMGMRGPAAAASANAARENNAMLNEHSRTLRSNMGFFKTLGTETMRLAANMSKAAMTSATWGAQRGGSMLGRGLKGVGGAVGSFMGGPVGIALGVGMGAVALGSTIRNDIKNTDQASKEAESTDAVGGAYRVALNLAAQATTTFADIVKRNANDMGSSKEQPGVISDKMDIEAHKPGRQYTDAKIGGMTAAEAKKYVSTTTMPDEEKQLLAYDLDKKFGRKVAQDILTSQAKRGGNIDTSSLFENLRSPWTTQSYTGRDAAASEKANKQATATGEINLAAIQGKYGPQAAAQYQASEINAGSKARMNGTNQAQIVSVLATQLGLNSEDKNVKHQLGMLLDASEDRQKDGTLKVTAATVQTMIDRVKADPKMFDSGVGEAILGVGRTAGAGADLTSTTYTPGIPKGTTPAPYASLSNYALSNVQSTGIGNIVFGDQNPTGKLAEDAVNSPGNANLQQRAMQGVADAALSAAGSFSGADEALQKWKASVGDASDQLYILANNAQMVVRQRQSEAMTYMTRGGQAGQVMANYQSSQRAALAAHGTQGESDAETRLEADRQAVEAKKADAYSFFRQIVTQQREFRISTERAQADFTLQRDRSDEDYQLGRKRNEDDFQLSRSRQEEAFGRQMNRTLRDYNRNRMYAQKDFDKSRRRNEEDYNHQVVLMAQQASQQVYNIYERVNVARTWSADNLMVNAQDQLDRLKEQASNLDIARGAGVSSDVIKLLGLNETANAQQLARFVADIAADPGVVKEFNRMAAERQKAAKKIVTDKDNTQWEEMQRSFKLNTDRALTDFNESMARQSQGFATSLRDMRTDYNISVSQAESDFAKARDRQASDYDKSIDRMIRDMKKQLDRGKADLNRSAEEITGSFETMGTLAIKGLTGTAKSQAQALFTVLRQVSKDTKSLAKTTATDVAHLFGQFGVAGVSSGGQGTNGDGGKDTHGGQTKYAAAGGYIDGYSPHKKADNINAKLTAGEYVHNVDAVSYYGKGMMDAINAKKIPKGEMQFASGGLVPFGRALQGKGFNVAEHPQFGGVHPVHTPGSWHYKAGAIDVNHDQGGEKAAINSIIGMARQYGLRVIWQVKDHFDHAHFDIGQGPDMIGPGVPTGSRGAGGDSDLLKAVKKLKSVKAWEKLRSDSRIVQMLADKDQLAETIVSGAISSGSGDVLKAAGPSGGSAAANAALGRRMAAAKGWTGPNWDALNWIYMHESGWNERADNPTSDAYGIPQALPGSKMASAGNDWRTNAGTQIKWGLGYIKERYGNPVKAQQFWKAHNWYGNGAIFAQGGKTIGVGERGPEMVLPLNQRGVEYLTAVMKQYSMADARHATNSSRGIPTQSGQITYNTRIDKSTVIKEVTVQAQDPNDMLRKIEAKKRLESLTSARRP